MGLLFLMLALLAMGVWVYVQSQRAHRFYLDQLRYNAQVLEAMDRQHELNRAQREINRQANDIFREMIDDKRAK